MSHRHLVLAYIATWVILIAYVGFLSLTARRLKREAEELQREASKR
jgi:CcmD family protein